MNSPITDYAAKRGTDALQDTLQRTVPAFAAFSTFGDDSRVLTLHTERVMRVNGLWLWGTTEETLIHDLRFGPESVFLINRAPIAGKFFEGGISFEEFSKRIDEEKPIESAPHQRIRSATVVLGHTIQLELSGPCEHAAVWGLTIL